MKVTVYTDREGSQTYESLTSDQAKDFDDLPFESSNVSRVTIEDK